MAYHRTGKFGRITKNLEALGHHASMDHMLHDSNQIATLSAKERASYVTKVLERMVDAIGEEETEEVMMACGRNCAGKLWSRFVADLRDSSPTLEAFIKVLNDQERDYNTSFSFDDDRKKLTITRTRCVCGLINHAKETYSNARYCACSRGHFMTFLGPVFDVAKITQTGSLLKGDPACVWVVDIERTVFDGI